jgi:hypothetical protein
LSFSSTKLAKEWQGSIQDKIIVPILNHKFHQWIHLKENGIYDRFLLNNEKALSSEKKGLFFINRLYHY